MSHTAGFEVLLVDDDAGMREALGMRIESWGYAVRLACDGAEAYTEIERDPPDLILTDIVLPGISGLELLERLQDAGARCPIILMTGHASVGWAVEAMKQGALDFLTKPVDHSQLQSLIEGAAELVGQKTRVRTLERELDEEPVAHGVIGRSRAMKPVFDAIELLGGNETSAILYGESGVGKEMVARAIHQASRRAAGPFVAVNTAAIPEGLIESEVFGHEKGAFTGASSARPGCFEQADGGTLLLDEIGDMPLHLQPRLLRILEAGRARRLGGSREIAFDVRVLAATNRDLDALIDDGILREDLFYRLNVFAIRIPPLREHADDDVPLLAQHFVRRFNEKHGTRVEGVSDEALDTLRQYSWPGNVRELRNVIERATVLARNGWVGVSELPRYITHGPDRGRKVVLPVGTDLAEAERRLILETLEAAGGNKSEAARQLGLDPKTIYNKLKSYREP